MDFTAKRTGAAGTIGSHTQASKEKAVTNVNHARLPRKTLSSQIDRLDGILDGLAEALNGAVADAVREAVGEAVREAVSATVREVLASPALLRAALAAHRQQETAPEAPAPQPPAQRRTLKEALPACLKRLLGGAGERGRHASAALHVAWSSCLARIKNAWEWAQARCRSLGAAALGVFGTICILGRRLWKLRRGCLLAVGPGLAAGATASPAGALLAGRLSGLSGAALSVAGMVLLPQWRLTRGGMPRAGA